MAKDQARGRSRPRRNHDEKVERILEVSERLLRDGGLDSLSVSAVARDLDVAPNAVYWYFPSRDELIVATLRRMLAAIIKGKPRESKDVVEKILWFVERLHQLHDIRAGLKDRATASRVVAEYLKDLDSLLYEMLSNTFRPYIPQQNLDLAVTSFISTAQGTATSAMSARQRRAILEFSLRQLLNLDQSTAWRNGGNTSGSLESSNRSSPTTGPSSKRIPPDPSPSSESHRPPESP